MIRRVWEHILNELEMKKGENSSQAKRFLYKLTLNFLLFILVHYHRKRFKSCNRIYRTCLRTVNSLLNRQSGLKKDLFRIRIALSPIYRLCNENNELTRIYAGASERINVSQRNTSVLRYRVIQIPFFLENVLK